MAVLTLYRLAEQSFNLIEGGDPAAASSISFGELKIACSQVINKLLKTEYFNVNLKTGQAIQDGTVLGLYENIEVLPYSNGRSKSTLPIKPLNLPRNMGVFSVFRTADPSIEFIPLQMGQANLLKSQPMINDLLGQIGFEVFGNEVVYTKNLKLLFPDETVSMRLAVLDATKYGDYDMLPVPPEMEWDVISEVYKMYSTQAIPDKVVDSSVKEEKSTPIREQKQ